MKFIQNPFEFFIMREYNFSLFWAIFGFLLVLFILVKLEKSSIKKYLDGVILSFLFIMVIGYIGAFFGGQVYGRETNFGIEMVYSNPYSIVPFQVPIFPLALAYTVGSFLIFSAMYILSLFIHVKGYIGYLWVILFSAMILIGETFSGKQDILSVYSEINLPQIYAVLMVVWWAWGLFHVFRNTWATNESYIEES